MLVLCSCMFAEQGCMHATVNVYKRVCIQHQSLHVIVCAPVVHVCMCVWMRACGRIHVCVYIYIYMHTCGHAYIHACICQGKRMVAETRTPGRDVAGLLDQLLGAEKVIAGMHSAYKNVCICIYIFIYVVSIPVARRWKSDRMYA